MKLCDNKVWLVQQNEAGLSQREIAKLADVSTPTIRHRFKKFNIKPRTISEALVIKPSRHKWTDGDKLYQSNKMKAVQAGRKSELVISAKKNWANNRDKFLAGIRLAAQNPERNAKIAQISKRLWNNSEYRNRTSIAVRLASDNPIVRAKISVSIKSLWEQSIYREKMAVVRAQLPKISSLQLKLYEYLDALNIQYIKEGEGTRIGFYVFDCKVRSQKTSGRHLLIECQGDYWHSLARAQNNDRSKFTYVDKHFPEYEIMYIWEREFYTKDRVLDRLKLKLGININTIDFDFKQIEIRPVTSKDVRSFLDAYHYIGKLGGGLTFGAYFDDILIACACYNRPLRCSIDNIDQSGLLELSRFCIHPSYHKKNFASWFLTKTLSTIKSLPIAAVVSFADTTVGHNGTIYRASGFVEHHQVPSDYWYCDTEGYVMHKQTLYRRAVQMKLTEVEYANKFNYMKRYGGNKLCFVRYFNGNHVPRRSP